MIPLKEAMSVKGGLGKTKGTEHRVTLNTPQREWELGSGQDTTAKEWIELLQEWIGLPKIERIQRSQTGSESAVKSQWMEVRVDAYTPPEISDEDLARYNTIQKESSFSRAFTLGTPRGRKKDKEEAPVSPVEAEKSDREVVEVEEEEEAAFKWVYVALMSDHTLRQYENELMTTELARLKLGYLVQATMLDEPIDTYEHAFRVKPESATSDTWICCPDSAEDSKAWIAVLKA